VARLDDPRYVSTLIEIDVDPLNYTSPGALLINLEETIIPFQLLGRSAGSLRSGSIKPRMLFQSVTATGEVMTWRGAAKLVAGLNDNEKTSQNLGGDRC